MARRRLDAELVRRGLAATTAEAQEAVRKGLVTVAGRPAGKASTLVALDEPLRIEQPPARFVSRGGEKLAAALDRFGIDPTGRDCLDAGSSTGGFTDCLLQRGAARVVAVDVGYGQLAWDLRNNERVTALERTNVRSLTREDLPFAPSLLVADLSFISLRQVAHVLVRLSSEGADYVLLVKPQFEAPPGRVGLGGVVRDPDMWRETIEKVATAFREQGLAPLAAMASPVVGPAGNVEFLLHAVGGGPDAPLEVGHAIGQALALRGLE